MCVPVNESSWPALNVNEPERVDLHSRVLDTELGPLIASFVDTGTSTV